MSVNIACAVPGCTNPVIGQCTGYQKNCGRYYCHDHSTDTLCSDCASRKSADEHAQLVYQEYLALAEKVFREPVSVPQFQFQGTNLIKVGGVSLALGFALLVFSCLSASVLANLNGQTSTMSGLCVFPILGSLALMGWPVAVIPLIWFAQRLEWISKEQQKRKLERVNEIEKEKPGFAQFWNAWMKQRSEEQAEKNKQALMGVLAVAGVIAAAAIGAALTESEYDRTRRAVRDELNSR